MTILIESAAGDRAAIQHRISVYQKVAWHQDAESARLTRLAWAVAELTEHLELLSGIRTEPRADAHGAPALRLVLDPQLGAQEARLAVAKDLTGTITGGGPAGILYGVYEVLEALGFRWFGPDDCEREVPAGIAGFTGIQKKFTPDFTRRGFLATEPRDTHGFLTWMARRKFNLWTDRVADAAWCRMLNIELAGGGHTLPKIYLSPEKYYAAHPEWYRLHNGRRNANMDESVKDNFCMSNPHACRQFAENLAESLEHGDLAEADLINIWPFDNGPYCECAACRKLGNPMSQLLHAVAVCQQTFKAKVSRPIEIVVPAYHETLAPPDREMPPDFDYSLIAVAFFPIERCYAHDFDAPECAEINATLLEHYRRWNADPRWRMLVGEYYNVSSFAGIAHLPDRRIAHDLLFYYQTGTRLIHYMHVPTAEWGPLTLTNDMFARYSSNVHCVYEDACDDFFSRRYHRLAAPAKTAYALLRHALGNAKPLKHYVGLPDSTSITNMRTHALYNRNLNEPGHPNIFQSCHLQFDRDFDQAAPSLLTTLRELDEVRNQFEALTRTTAAADDALLRARLVKDLRRIRYSWKLVRFIYVLVRLREFEQRNELDLAALEARELRDLGEALRMETAMTALCTEDSPLQRLFRNGLNATCFARTYATLMAQYQLETPDTPGGKLMSSDTDQPLA